MTRRKGPAPVEVMPRVHGGRVPDVRDLPCPARGDGDRHSDRVHVLGTNTEKGEAVTRCVWCHGKWADLDAAARPEAS